MKVVKCVNNHFFDSDKYNECPQCGAAQQSDSGAASSGNRTSDNGAGSVSSKLSKAGETFGVFKNKVAKKESSGKKSPFASNNYEKLKQFNNEPSSKKPIWEREPVEDNTTNIPETNSLLDNQPQTIEEPAPVPVPVAETPVSAPASAPVPVSVPVPVAAPVADAHSEPSQSDVAAAEQENTLLEEIKKVASDNDGKTVGFFSSGKSTASSSADDSDDSKSSAPEPANAPSEEPVVGWLICIQGPNIGQCFNIYAGKNSLGRSNTNKIIINKDRSISRDKHSWIIYEPRKRDFFAQPGDSSGLTYVNEEVIMQPTKLEKKTIIEVGNTKLMLFPLCGEDFSWEDYL